MVGVQLEKIHDASVSISVCGSIQKVLAGAPEEHWQSETFDANSYKMGLGAASPESFESMGEGIIIDGQCYATVTNQSKPDFMKTVGNRKYYSMLMSGIPNEAKPNYVCNSVSCKAEMYDLISSLYSQVPYSVAWRGLLKCSQINSMILKKSPIYGIPIFDHKEEYLENKVFNQPTWVLMVGAYTSDEAPNRNLVEHLKERVFYVNPLDEKTDVYTHTHGLLLNKEVENSEEVCPDLASHAVHILNKNTIVTGIKFLELYIIDNVQTLEPCK